MENAFSPPKKVVLVLLDSLNRHMLGCYGGTEFETPNLDRLARKSSRFMRHYTGSLPCMPARHDILVGSMDFLWRPWGSIELWERPITYGLRRKEIVSMLISDHPHLFETGGENYHTDFFAWDYLRGHESDPWRTREDPSGLGTPALAAGVQKAYGKQKKAYDLSRSWFREEADYPGPKTMQAAADWLKHNGNHHDSFFLFVDEFDPHEPFDTPMPWASKYDPDWKEERIIWPPYAIDATKKGIINEAQARHIRANYGAKLSMIDHWLGRVLDEMDRQSLWDDTLFILCTDHGHYLGERDLFGKPQVPQYETLGRIPLMIACPGVEAGEINALTTGVDIHATLVDLFALEVEHQTHGHSLMPLLTGQRESVRDWVLGGVFGQWVQIQDGTNKYIRAPQQNGFPLSMWSNRWSTMPIPGLPGLRLPDPDRRAWLDFMPGSDIPVIRQPFQEGDLLPYWSMNPGIDQHHLYDIESDPQEKTNLIGRDKKREEVMQSLLREALSDVDAPGEQWERLGI